MSKFFSIEQVGHSLKRIETLHPFFGMSFLAFKMISLPIGDERRINFSQLTTQLLSLYYRPASRSAYFYNPFQTSKREDRWIRPRYPSTSLQRITKDTFGDVLLHNTQNDWGWREDYVAGLKEHLTSRIPAFDLAVWIYRTEEWPDEVTHDMVMERFFDDHFFYEDEIEELFTTTIQLSYDPWVSDVPLTEQDVLRLIGHPPDSATEAGAALRFLELREIGPATLFTYRPAPRLNILTGDNSLGKTFILESIWWALTGEWLERPVTPRSNVAKNKPYIKFEISTLDGVGETFLSEFDWEYQTWTVPRKPATIGGLVVYARYDGSFAIWDPTRKMYGPAPHEQGGSPQTRGQGHIFFDRNALWYGLQMEDGKGWICNGLLRDWVSWQTSGARYQDRWEALVACLHGLAPSDDEPIEPGEPTKMPFNELEIPTIHMPYEEVPVLIASAGVQRAIALAYMLVWTWFRHLDNSLAIRRDPQKSIVLIIDEVEAHLHPRWQRVIVPSLLDVVTELAPQVTPQIHLATHSPLVMASTETVFNEETDDLHHLKLVGGEVVLEELPFQKRGRADWWLMSDVFGLDQARSLPAEEAIKDAIALQESEHVPPEAVREVHARLVKYLAADDDFWPRWRFFAKQHGGESD